MNSNMIQEINIRELWSEYDKDLTVRPMHCGYSVPTSGQKNPKA
jgi:hypothetical protein